MPKPRRSAHTRHRSPRTSDITPQSIDHNLSGKPQALHGACHVSTDVSPEPQVRVQCWDRFPSNPSGPTTPVSRTIFVGVASCARVAPYAGWWSRICILLSRENRLPTCHDRPLAVDYPAQLILASYGNHPDSRILLRIS